MKPQRPVLAGVKVHKTPASRKATTNWRSRAANLRRSSLPGTTCRGIHRKGINMPGNASRVRAVKLRRHLNRCYQRKGKSFVRRAGVAIPRGVVNE